MKKLKLFIYGYLLVMLMILVAGCRKQEFTLPPEGEKVPYVDTAKRSLKEVLEKSPAKLFYQAWKRSNIEGLLKSISDSKTTFTVLMPSDAAMENAGFTTQKISDMQVKDLDSLMMFYTLKGRITAQDLENKPDNYIGASVLTKLGVRVSLTQSTAVNLNDIVPYYYQQRLQVKDGKTYVNGKIAGAGKFVAAKDGYVWLLDQMITKPDKTIMEVLKADGNFTLLLAILQYTDDQYAKIMKDGLVFTGARVSFIKRYNWSAVRQNPWDQSLFLVRTTALLPKDEAFKNAGFNSLEDLKKFNIKRGLPRVVKDQFGRNIVMGNFATDSLLGYHLDFGARVNSRSALFMSSNPVNFGFNTNEMTNAVMSNYLVSMMTPLIGRDDMPYIPYYMPLDFSRDASGRVQVKVKEVPDGTAASIVEADIPTLMGPIHVVDHFLTPKGFKLN